MINKLLRRFGYVVVPITSGKMLHEHANVSEAHHPSRGGRTVEWMRKVADEMPYYGESSFEKSLPPRSYPTNYMQGYREQPWNID